MSASELEMLSTSSVSPNSVRLTAKTCPLPPPTPLHWLIGEAFCPLGKSTAFDIAFGDFFFGLLVAKGIYEANLQGFKFIHKAGEAQC